MSLEPGTQLGPFTVMAPLGAGGMGEVYRARDAALERDVAIKVLRSDLSWDEDRQLRFEREAKLLAKVSHENVATLYEVSRSGDEQFLVMELVEGETLAERIADGPVPFDDARKLFIQVASGLEAAHEHGVVHRDLKPANIKITHDGKVKVLDFGLAKASSVEVDAPGLSESPTVTKGTAVGEILGTAPYMSPEQARGRTVDRRTDVWAFGCCLYEALTGDQLFRGDTVADTIARILQQDPDWRRLTKTTPASVRTLIQRCLTRDSHHRLQHIGDARIELENIREIDEPKPASPLWPVLAFATLGTGLAALVISLVTNAPSSAGNDVERFALPLPGESELYLAGDDFGAGSLAISPDGARVAFVAQREAGLQLYIREMGVLEARPVGPVGAKLPFFSPDGQWLAFFDGTALKKVAVTGGAPATIAKFFDLRGGSWGDDGTIVVGASSNAGRGLMTVSSDGGTPNPLTVPDRANREKTHRFPSLLPGSRNVLFTLGSADINTFDDAAVAIASLETGEYRVLVEGGMHPRYSPTGHLVYAREGALLALPFDLKELEVTGAPVTVLEGVVTLPDWGSAPFDLSDTGSLIYAPGGSRFRLSRLVAVDRTGRSEAITREIRPYQGAGEMSPDGTRLAFSMYGANHSLWSYDLARDTLSQVATGFENMGPRWTPDGGRFAFWSNRDGPFAIYWTALDGTSPPELLTAGEYTRAPSSFSPDGSTLLFMENHPLSGDDIWIMSVDSELAPKPILASRASEGYPRFSPDGRFIAYQSDETGVTEVFVRSVEGGGHQRQVSSGGGQKPMWSRDGNELFYRNGSAMIAVDVDTSDGIQLGRPKVLFEKSGDGFTVAPDGRFVMNEPVETDPAPTELILVKNWLRELERLVPTN